MSSASKIVICDIYPDMDMDIFDNICNRNDIMAVIIRTYGTGGVPDKNHHFIRCIEKLHEDHKIVVNLTQCPKGNVELRVFETNTLLFDNGVISGGDMVTEAAYCKLKYLFSMFEYISKKEDRARIIRHYMMVAMRDELSMSMFIISIYSNSDSKCVSKKIGKNEVEFKQNSNWSDNPADDFSDRSANANYSNDSFAKFDHNLHYITNAVLRLGDITIRNLDGSKISNQEIIPSIIVSIVNKYGTRSDKAIHERKYSIDDKNINIDILSQARHMLKESEEFSINIYSERHEIEVGKVDLLLSVVKRKGR
jgi:hypothetical protein